MIALNKELFVNKPYSESCDQNRAPILAQLQRLLVNHQSLLEIGSGTGQHAAWMPQFLPHLRWQPSDVTDNLAGIQAWLAEAALPNVHAPIALNVAMEPWPQLAIDCVFSANTAHIMSIDLVQRLFEQVGALLPSGGRFLLYGPFNYGGQFTSPSNARFDQWLKARDPRSGVRDFETLNDWAQQAGMQRLEDIEMPANNRILAWER